MNPTLPHISVVIPFKDARSRQLKATLESLMAQSYHAFRVFVFHEADSPTHLFGDFENIDFVQIDGNFWKTLNDQLNSLYGEQLTILHPEDVITEDFLLTCAAFDDKAIVYTDESRIGDWGRISHVNHRPDFDWLLLQHLDYFRYGSVYNLAILKEIGGFRWATESPTHDYALRVLEKFGEDAFHHIPNQFYRHRRKFREMISDPRNEDHMTFFDPRAISQHLNRIGLTAAEVWDNNGTPYCGWNEPRRDMIEVVIFHPSGDHLLRLYQRIQETTGGRNVFVSLLAPQSELRALGSVLGGVSNAKVIAANNTAGALTALDERSQKTMAEFVCYLDRPESLDYPLWLDDLWAIASRPGVGMVSPRVTTSVDTLEYLGVQADDVDPLLAPYYHKDGRGRGRFNRGMVGHQVTWPAPSCVMFRARDVHGGFDPQFDLLAFHDLALFIRAQGLAVAVAPLSSIRVAYTPAYADYMNELPLLYAKHGANPPNWPQVFSFPWP